MRDGISVFHRVAYGIDIRIVGLVRFVHPDDATASQLQTRLFGDPDVWSDTDGANDEVRSQDPSVDERDGPLFYGGDSRSRFDVDAVSDQLVAHEDGELRVEWREDLRSRFDDGDVDALADEVLCHLEPDEPGPDDDRGSWCDADVGGEAGGVFDGPEGADPVVSGDGRADRGGPHAEHQ